MTILAYIQIFIVYVIGRLTFKKFVFLFNFQIELTTATSILKFTTTSLGYLFIDFYLKIVINCKLMQSKTH